MIFFFVNQSLGKIHIILVYVLVLFPSFNGCCKLLNGNKLLTETFCAIIFIQDFASRLLRTLGIGMWRKRQFHTKFLSAIRII